MPGGRYVWWNEPLDGLDIPVIFVEVSIVGSNLKKVFLELNTKYQGLCGKSPKSM
jgi:hypothetical protein